MLWFMGLQRVGHDRETKLNIYIFTHTHTHTHIYIIGIYSKAFWTIMQDVSMCSRKKQLVKYFCSIYTFCTFMIKNDKDKNRIK